MPLCHHAAKGGGRVFHFARRRAAVPGLRSKLRREASGEPGRHPRAVRRPCGPAISDQRSALSPRSPVFSARFAGGRNVRFAELPYFAPYAQSASPCQVRASGYLAPGLPGVLLHCQIGAGRLESARSETHACAVSNQSTGEDAAQWHTEFRFQSR